MIIFSFQSRYHGKYNFDLLHSVVRFLRLSLFIFKLQVSPQSMGGGLTYESCNGIVTKYNQNYQQNSEVPTAIRDKLRHLPTIIKHLMQPKHRNIR